MDRCIVIVQPIVLSQFVGMVGSLDVIAHHSVHNANVVIDTNSVMTEITSMVMVAVQIVNMKTIL